jgi:hypothetical protein
MVCICVFLLHQESFNKILVNAHHFTMGVLQLQAIYFYIHEWTYNNSGSKHEKVSLPRAVGGFHSVQAYSGVFQAPSCRSLSPPW